MVADVLWRAPSLLDPDRRRRPPARRHGAALAALARRPRRSARPPPGRGRHPPQRPGRALAALGGRARAGAPGRGGEARARPRGADPGPGRLGGRAPRCRGRRWRATAPPSCASSAQLEARARDGDPAPSLAVDALPLRPLAWAGRTADPAVLEGLVGDREDVFVLGGTVTTTLVSSAPVRGAGATRGRAWPPSPSRSPCAATSATSTCTTTTCWPDRTAESSSATSTRAGESEGPRPFDLPEPGVFFRDGILRSPDGGVLAAVRAIVPPLDEARARWRRTTGAPSRWWRRSCSWPGPPATGASTDGAPGAGRSPPRPAASCSSTSRPRFRCSRPISSPPIRTPPPCWAPCSSARSTSSSPRSRWSSSPLVA